jgi:bifunctional UDP-N-acetylglucosamine pyrophosphorylase/glucosamine-1-phosphate N-acetyltransferase
LSKDFTAVIMAAGKSVRMKSAIPKAAHLICGKPMTRHVIDACMEAPCHQIIVVIGHEAEVVKNALGDDVGYAYQLEQLGTGHACLQSLPHIPKGVTDVLALPGDTPLITAESIRKLMDAHKANNNAATLLTAVLDDASHYGRVVRDKKTGDVLKIVEAKDADEAILAIQEINTSIYCFNKAALAEKLALIRTDNAQGELYLTDVVELLKSSGHRVGAVIADNAADTLGINNRVELAEAASIKRKRILEAFMLAGVTIIDPATTYIDCDVEIGADTIVHPCTIIGRGSRIGKNCEVGPFARLTKIMMGDGRV